MQGLKLDINEDDEFNIWKSHICAGNKCFDDKKTVPAIVHYQKSIVAAEDLLEHSDNDRAAVAAVIVSSHNLADLYIQANEIALAENELRNVHFKLTALLDGADNNSDRFDAILWGASRTYFVLVRHLQNHAGESQSSEVVLPYLNLSSKLTNNH